MLDPVTDECGEVYEREEILCWFNKCRDKNLPFTSPHTNEILTSDKVYPSKFVKRQINDFLEKEPQYWEQVYISTADIKIFNDSLANNDKETLISLIKREPRFSTYNNFELFEWIMKTKDITLLDTLIVPHLSERGQISKFIDLLNRTSQEQWEEAIHLLITTHKWSKEEYLACARKWIFCKHLSSLKSLLDHMQKLKFQLDLEDDSGNTLLHYAAEVGDVDTITSLLALGFDCKIANQHGVTAEEIANTNNHRQVIDIFKGYSLQSSSANPILQLIHNDIKDLKNQVEDLRSQSNYEISQVYKAIRYTSAPTFTYMKQKLYKKYFFESKSIKLNDYAGSMMLLPENGSILALLSERNPQIWNLETGLFEKALDHDEAFDAVILPGNKIVTIGENSIKVWDKSRECIAALHKAEDSEYFLAIALWPGSENCVAIISELNMKFIVKVWDFVNDRYIRNVICNDPNLPDEIGANIFVLPNQIVAISNGHSIELWDLEKEELIRVLEGHSDMVGILEQTPNGKLISCSYDHTLRVWNTENGVCEHTLMGHTSRVSDVAIISESLIVTSSDDKTIKVWNLETNECLQTLKSHSNEVYDVILLADGSLASCSTDSTIKVWKINPALKELYDSEKAIASLVHNL